ncbi:uncharacterized protein LOC111406547 [Olea europaea var. sylvestris]|uniref:uncharacterized protein LOC111406547 n=1 Tax=Olea europaea var. sylvestris TaxID=158386 RepID=UPI000C1CF353|nr:uncharacterized protein LOC111406547 [Olea europaea var. sylvestris]
MDCQEIVVQPQLIHYFLLREVKQSNLNEMRFKVANKYVRLSLYEFCVVTGLRCKDVRKNLEHIPSKIKGTYFRNLKLVTNEDVRDVFLNLLDADDHDIVSIRILYLITSFLFSTSYKKVVENYLFTLVEDFAAMERSSWGKKLFEKSIKSLREGLSHRNLHYRLKGFLIALVRIYESIPSLTGPITNRVGNRHRRIVNWALNRQHSAVKLDEEVFSKLDCSSREK